jgi:hypothetical protein
MRVGIGSPNESVYSDRAIPDPLGYANSGGYSNSWASNFVHPRSLRTCDITAAYE